MANFRPPVAVELLEGLFRVFTQSLLLLYLPSGGGHNHTFLVSNQLFWNICFSFLNYSSIIWPEHHGLDSISKLSISRDVPGLGLPCYYEEKFERRKKPSS